MAFMNRVFRKYLDFLVNVFINDISIYSRRENDHMRHWSIVLQGLKDNQPFAKFSKSEF